jgi:aminopeptidase N
VAVDAIHEVREFVLVALAKQLEKIWLETYKKYHDKEMQTYHFNMSEVGNRQLKNRCLSYLMLLPAYEALGDAQFNTSIISNMTDTQPALVALSNINSSLRNKALEKFYTTWRHDALVVDKWLAIQAATKLPIALQEVKKLMRHEAFDIKNPNKVYSLVGTFSQRNAVNFHAINGEGYAFLRETVAELDKLNPQVSARMVKPLTTWKRYDKERQVLMREQLESLLQEKSISKDLYELVSKSLE